MASENDNIISIDSLRNQADGNMNQTNEKTNERRDNIIYFESVKKQADEAADANRILNYGELIELPAVRDGTDEQNAMLSPMVGEAIENYKSYSANFSTGPKSLEPPNQALSMVGNEMGGSRKNLASGHFKNNSNNEIPKAS